jgi:predicted lipoprotein with Yx(FWY)xxD motif
LKRILVLLAAVAGAASFPGALASASARRAVLQLRRTAVGTILVDSRGFTLYAFTSDPRAKDVCVQIRGCAGIWPLTTTSSKPIARRGVNASLIGTITLKGGAKQVTYAGHPLYGYIADSAPGQTFYVNFLQFGGRWPAMDAAGHEVK